MKKIASFIPAILWLIISILHFVEGNLKKGHCFYGLRSWFDSY